MVNVILLPTPAEVTLQLPPISSVSCWEMARPRPDPSCERVMFESTWLNDLNRREIFWSGMPTPWIRCDHEWVGSEQRSTVSIREGRTVFLT